MNSDMFTEGERTVEKEWHIHLNPIIPATIDVDNVDFNNEDFSDDLDELDLIPEHVTLDGLSFYFSGTYKDAYNRAEEMCHELNQNRDIGDSMWEFESASIIPVEE